MFERTKINEKDAGVGQFFKKNNVKKKVLLLFNRQPKQNKTTNKEKDTQTVE